MPKYKGQFEGMCDAQMDEAVPLFRAECLVEIATFCINKGIPFVFHDVDDGMLAIDISRMTWLQGTTPYEHVKKLFDGHFRSMIGPVTVPGYQLKTDEGGVMINRGPHGKVTLDVFNTVNDDI